MIPLRVLADENIPFAAEAFAEFGEVVTYAGRALTPNVAADADILLVRSVTRVGPELLAGSRVRFVATATIGAEHVDAAWLASRGIGFASAPGSNANSVSEYVTAALLEVADRLHIRLDGLTIGIVGVGNVGSRVARKVVALGMRPLLNDPPLQRSTGDAKYLPLERVLDADVITMHVPLTKDGPDATYHLADERFFSSMRKGSVFINTSRGKVADGNALMAALKAGRLSAAVLDVWETEPNIDVELLNLVAIGTPHIAGYSYDGKVNGTKMIYESACRFFGRRPAWRPSAEAFPVPKQPLIAPVSGEAEYALRSAIRIAYDIRSDDAALRKIKELPPAERGAHFDRLRKQYPVRREWPATTVRIEDARLRGTFAELDFRVT